MKSEILDIKSFLQDKGCKIQQSGGEIQIVATWRGGQNFSVSINPRNGNWFDFVEASGGSFDKLVTLLGGEITDQNYSFSNTDWVDELKLPQKFDISILNGLIKDYSYWENRAIDKVIFDEFTAGIFKDGKMAKRHCTVIYGQNKEIVGVSGRALENWMKPKWKHLFKVSDVCFPLYLNKEIIKEKQEVVIVESLGNLFSLWSAGIKNVICIFGTRLHNKILSNLISLNLKNIIVSLDNDSENHNVGNLAAENVKIKLSNFFDENIIKIILPPEKDWNETLVARGPDSIVGLLREKSI